MTIQQAIQKAVSGGYSYDIRTTYRDKIFLDPLFWQSLGKSMGWREESKVENDITHRFDPARWLIEWHRFIDHLAEGKDINSFFENLK